MRMSCPSGCPGREPHPERACWHLHVEGIDGISDWEECRHPDRCEACGVVHYGRSCRGAHEARRTSMRLTEADLEAIPFIV